MSTKHMFDIVNCDTDSISICNHSGIPLSVEEQNSLIAEINSMLPEMIRFEHDGYYEKIIVFKAKNYVMWDGKKLKTKGSALKKSTSEPAIKEFVKRFIDYLLENKENQLVDLYHEYIKEVINITDMKRWSIRKTITEKVLSSVRTNETKVLDAMKGVEFSEGDRVYLFFDEDESLKRVEDFQGKYHMDKYLEKVYKALKTFETVCDMSMFTNYKLKKNKELLENLK